MDARLPEGDVLDQKFDTVGSRMCCPCAVRRSSIDGVRGAPGFVVEVLLRLRSRLPFQAPRLLVRPRQGIPARAPGHWMLTSHRLVDGR